MFIYCYDKDLERDLLAKGFRKAKYPKDANYSVFYNSKKLKFDFSNFDGEFEFSNKLTF